MDSVLIVSSTEKSTTFFREAIEAASIEQIATTDTCSEARRLLRGRGFNIVIVNAPLRDESGDELTFEIAGKATTQIIFVVSGEHYDIVAHKCEECGVLAVARPINRLIFQAVLSLARAVQHKTQHLQEENLRLRQQIEDIKMIDRAKCILISYMGLSEPEAHRAIERQAMDMRTSKRAVAEEILKTYEF
ncbi:MAG: ANTAR domain-containing protein [Lachnospiraceae bacterium]|nr:ANTAR domain-containing protein [Lachnospiraceae bacterium]